jgi:hypothetical protein
VKEARQRWEQVRVEHGYRFEESWIGSKLGIYLKRASYQQVQVRRYHIRRSFSELDENLRAYLRGIGEWFMSESAPSLSHMDIACWRCCFFDPQDSKFSDPAARILRNRISGDGQQGRGMQPGSC